MTELLLLFAIVLGVNLMPAFGPPTWAVIVLYGLRVDTPLAATVLTAAAAAALGRWLLAHVFRLFGARLPRRLRDNLSGAREALVSRRRGTVIGLGIFALSPVPSAQLFEAAGLARMPLVGFTLAFFAGRTVSYAIYAYGARRIRQTSLGELFVDSLASPWGLALQIAMIALLVLFTQIDWRRVFRS